MFLGESVLQFFLYLIYVVQACHLIYGSRDLSPEVRVV